MSKLFIILPLFTIFLIIKIIVSIKKNNILKCLFTPLTTLTIISIPILSLYNGPNQYSIMILCALIFSLVGDIFNIFADDDKSFLQYGMFFFIFTHIFYISIFLKDYTFNYYQLITIFVMIIILIVTHYMFKNQIKEAYMKYGIILYTALVSATLFFASGNLWTEINNRTILISIGALLFLLSDFFLGTHHFKNKIKYEPIFVWGLYAPGQLLIALSIIY